MAAAKKSKPGKFGGANYQPKNLGPEPATSSAPAAPALPQRIKVAFSTRVTAEADAQLKALARDGHSQTDLVARALNLLFRELGKPEVA